MVRIFFNHLSGYIYMPAWKTNNVKASLSNRKRYLILKENKVKLKNPLIRLLFIHEH